MARGQIGLVRHAEGCAGKGVEWATDSTSHHVVVDIGYGLCVSAEPPRVVIRPTSSFHSLEWSQFNLSAAQLYAIVQSALSMVGRPYNMAVIFVLLLRKLTRVPVPRFVREWLNRRRNVDCSQLADIALTSGGIRLFPQDAALVTPADFEAYYRSMGWLNDSLSVPSTL